MNKFIVMTISLWLVASGASAMVTVELINTSATVSGEQNQIGNFSIEFAVTARGKNAFIPGTAILGGGSEPGVHYIIEEDVGVSVVSGSLFPSGLSRITKGTFEIFTLSVDYRSDETSTVRLALESLNFTDEIGETTTHVRNLNPQRFHTDFVTVNPTPIPLPSASLLMGISLFGLLGFRRLSAGLLRSPA